MSTTVHTCPACNQERVISTTTVRLMRAGYQTPLCRSCAQKVKAQPDLEERFAERFQRVDTGCWVWTAGTNNHGYGQLRRGGGRGSPLVLAHRVSWEIHNGQIPDGKQVLHHCDNPPCVNPAHLWLGDPKANSDDKIRKGRQRGGRPRATA